MAYLGRVPSPFRTHVVSPLEIFCSAPVYLHFFFFLFFCQVRIYEGHSVPQPIKDLDVFIILSCAALISLSICNILLEHFQHSVGALPLLGFRKVLIQAAPAIFQQTQIRLSTTPKLLLFSAESLTCSRGMFIIDFRLHTSQRKDLFQYTTSLILSKKTPTLQIFALSQVVPRHFCF